MANLATSLCFVALAVSCVIAEPIRVPDSKLNLNHEDLNRVVGGVNAPLGSAPFQVSLRTNQGHFCGGAIISIRWVITTASCLVGKHAKEVLSVVGTNTLNAGGIGYETAGLVLHEQYNTNSRHNDLGLVQTVLEIYYNNTVGPIGLPSYDTGAGLRATLYGWGYLSANGPIPNYLQMVDLQTISNEACQSALSNVNQIVPSQLCAFISQGKGACNGDTGGPLVVGGQLAGVVSWGEPCAVGLPDVYTRIFAYRDWIRYYTGV